MPYSLLRAPKACAAAACARAPEQIRLAQAGNLVGGLAGAGEVEPGNQRLWIHRSKAPVTEPCGIADECSPAARWQGSARSLQIPDWFNVEFAGPPTVGQGRRLVPVVGSGETEGLVGGRAGR